MIYLLVFSNVHSHNNHLGVNKQYTHNFSVIKLIDRVLLLSTGNRIYFCILSRAVINND